ncbi:carboxylesterase family protein [Nocardia sp. NPDC051030]|uniref:carboxylesterase/lipase family protein n=1 Tax=Nocardia sp. NPDC051030 TaxID=3155162 RepID=UPI00343A145C
MKYLNGRSRWLSVLALAAVVAASATGCAASNSTAADTTTVTVDTGSLKGREDGEARLFQGIPYAAAPVAERRWQPPASAAHWDGVRDATSPGARCMQAPDGHGLLPVNLAPASTPEPTNEDCLFLNVRTPAKAADSPLPVMVWIHGGSFSGGSGAAYDTTRLSEQGIVTVTLNYRLGSLGFLAHPDLDTDGTGGNYGLMDQQAALRWVQRNIAVFGGDPAKVTIAGESAGGVSVCGHLAAPGSAGLFRAAVMQSGPCGFAVPHQVAVDTSAAYATSLGCTANVADCLRKVPADKLAATPVNFPVWYGHMSAGTGYWLLQGGSVLPEHPAVAATRATVPVLIGTNRDEMRMGVYLGFESQHQTLGAAAYSAAVASVDKDAPAQYPLSAYESPSIGYGAAATDAWVCDVNTMARQFPATTPVFAYELADSAPFPTTTSFPMGAYHTGELPYLFNVADLPVTLDQQQRQLSDRMIRYWANFIRTGDPNASGLTEWPMATTGSVLSLAAEQTAIDTKFESRHHCGFWTQRPQP